MGKEQLPKHIINDGAKWLMMPSKVVLEGVSLWPKCQTNITKILHFLCIASLLASMGGQLYQFTRGNGSLEARAFAISFFIVSAESLSRRVLLINYRKKLSDILSTLYDDFWPSDMFGEDVHKDIYRKSMHCAGFCGLYTFIAFLDGVQFITAPYEVRDFPLRSRYPPSWEQSPYYELVYVWQSFMSLEIVFTVCGVDFFFISLVYNCIAQFKLLREYLRVNFLKSLQEESEDSTRKAKEVLWFCVKRHNRLIQVCTAINNVFTYFMLIQCLASMFIVCTSLFVARVVPKDFGTAANLFMGHICEIFAYCYMGNDLILESMKVADTAFECGWHLASQEKDMQKTLIMMMIRSQKPVRISTGGFGHLSLTSFGNLIKFSFSVYTLLQSMMKK